MRDNSSATYGARRLLFPPSRVSRVASTAALRLPPARHTRRDGEDVAHRRHWRRRWRCRRCARQLYVSCDAAAALCTLLVFHVRHVPPKVAHASARSRRASADSLAPKPAKEKEPRGIDEAALENKIRNAVLSQASALREAVPGPKVYPPVATPEVQVRAGAGRHAACECQRAATTYRRRRAHAVHGSHAHYRSASS